MNDKPQTIDSYEPPAKKRRVYEQKPLKFEDWEWASETMEEHFLGTLQLGGTYNFWQIESGEVIVVRAVDCLPADVPIEECDIWWVVNGPLSYGDALRWCADEVESL